MAPWRQATGRRRQRRRHLHPLLLCAVLACSSSNRGRKQSFCEITGIASHAEKRIHSASQAHRFLRCQPPRLMPSGMPAMPKTSMSKEPRPGLANGTLQWYGSCMMWRAGENDTGKSSLQGVEHSRAEVDLVHLR